MGAQMKKISILLAAMAVSLAAHANYTNYPDGIFFLKNQNTSTYRSKNANTGEFGDDYTKTQNSTYVRYVDNAKIFAFSLIHLDYGAVSNFVQLSRHLYEPGAKRNEVIHTYSHRGFMRENGTGATVETKTKVRFNEIKTDVNTSTFTFGTQGYGSRTKIPGANGEETVREIYKNINVRVGDFTIVNIDSLSRNTPVESKECFDFLNDKSREFLTRFSGLHQDALGAKAELNACRAKNGGDCEEFAKKYTAADKAREELWDTYTVDDTSALEPHETAVGVSDNCVHVAATANSPKVDVCVSSEESDGDSGGGKCPSWGCGPAPYQPPAAPTPTCGRHGCH